MRIVGVVVSALLFSSAQADFQNCFCISSHGTWCGADLDNNFWRDSCEDWASGYFWTLPLAGLMVLLTLYPIVSVLCRVCCGGRKPTPGCCSITRVSRDEEERALIVRRYNTRTIILIKSVFSGCVGVWIYYFVYVVVSGIHIHEALNDLIGSVSAQSASNMNLIALALNASEHLAAAGAPFVNQSVVNHLRLSQQTYQSHDDVLQRVLRTIDDVENQQWGLSDDTWGIPAICILILFISLIMVLCNSRSALITICSGLMSLGTVMVVALLVGYEVSSQVTTAACDNYNTTVVPFVTNAGLWSDACGSTLVTNEMNDAALSYFADACQHGLVSLCSADQFQCPAGAVQRLCHNASAIGEGSVNGWQSLALLLEETFLNSYILSDAVCNASRNRMCSITECAMYCSADSQSKNDSIALVDFMDAYSVSMNVIVIDFFPSYANCSALSESLLSPEIHGTLCNELTPQLEGISSLFVFLSSLSIAALILLALANNRYQKLEQNVDEPTPPQPTIVEDAEGEPPRSISSTSITYWGRLQGDRESVSDARVLYGTGVNRLGYPSREEPFLGLVIGSSATSRATSYGSVQRER